MKAAIYPMIPARCAAIRDTGERCRSSRNLVTVQFSQPGLSLPSTVVAQFCPKHFNPIFRKDSPR